MQEHDNCPYNCDIRQGMPKMNQTLDEIKSEVNKLSGESRIVPYIFKYCVFPLISILGVLVGIKIVWPSIASAAIRIGPLLVRFGG